LVGHEKDTNAQKEGKEMRTTKKTGTTTKAMRRTERSKGNMDEAQYERKEEREKKQEEEKGLG
jgi:hypothetical protein